MQCTTKHADKLQKCAGSKVSLCNCQIHVVFLNNKHFDNNFFGNDHVHSINVQVCARIFFQNNLVLCKAENRVNFLDFGYPGI